MTALKLERLKENAYAGLPFWKRYHVTSLKQSSTSDILLRMFGLFPAKLLHKTSLNAWLERVFISLVRQVIIVLAMQLSTCNKKSTVIAFRKLLKFHESLEGTKPFTRSIL